MLYEKKDPVHKRHRTISSERKHKKCDVKNAQRLKSAAAAALQNLSAASGYKNSAPEDLAPR